MAGLNVSNLPVGGLDAVEKQWCREGLKTLRAVIYRKLNAEKNVDIRALREKELLAVDAVTVKFL